MCVYVSVKEQGKYERAGVARVVGCNGRALDAKGCERGRERSLGRIGVVGALGLQQLMKRGRCVGLNAGFERGGLFLAFLR